MTIQEAIKSGKRYRIKGNPWWINKEDIKQFLTWEVLSEEWEVEREPRQIMLCRSQDSLNVWEECDEFCKHNKTTEIIKVREVLE